MERGRGQALVELALVLPLILLVILGGVQLGLALIIRLELAHAAIEGATAGARSGGCNTALGTLAEVYGRAPSHAACRVEAALLTVDASVAVPLLVPVGQWTVAVRERAAIP